MGQMRWRGPGAVRPARIARRRGLARRDEQERPATSPLGGIRTGLRNAASIAGLLITTDAMVTEAKEEEEEED